MDSYRTSNNKSRRRASQRAKAISVGSTDFKSLRVSSTPFQCHASSTRFHGAVLTSSQDVAKKYRRPTPPPPVSAPETAQESPTKAKQKKLQVRANSIQFMWYTLKVYNNRPYLRVWRRFENTSANCVTAYSHSKLIAMLGNHAPAAVKTASVIHDASNAFRQVFFVPHVSLPCTSTVHCIGRKYGTHILGTLCVNLTLRLGECWSFVMLNPHVLNERMRKSH